MALEPCPECNGQVSNIANSCPHCGYPIARKRLIKTAKQVSQQAFSREKPAQVPPTPPQDGYLIEASKADEIFSRMVRTRGPLGLWRFNGIGVRVGNRTPIARMAGEIIAVAPLYFTFLFIPVWSFGWRVVRLSEGGFAFLGRIDPHTLKRLLGDDICRKTLREELKNVAIGAGVGVVVIGGLLFLLTAMRRGWR